MKLLVAGGRGFSLGRAGGQLAPRGRAVEEATELNDKAKPLAYLEEEGEANAKDGADETVPARRGGLGDDKESPRRRSSMGLDLSTGVRFEYSRPAPSGHIAIWRSTQLKGGEMIWGQGFLVH